MDKALKNILRNNPAIWCGSESVKSSVEGLSTGFAVLDDVLPTRGWPLNGLVEVLLPRWGIGELQLLLPAIISISQQKKRVAWIAPPFVPYAPALVYAGVDLGQHIVMPKEDVKAEVLWATEKILRNQHCGIVMCWPQKVSDKAMRRLQIAAEEKSSLGFIFRNQKIDASPAALRISLAVVKDKLQVTLLKARGASHYRSVLLDIKVV